MYRTIATAVLGTLLTTNTMRAETPAARNIHLVEQLRPAVQEMLAASATFRRQWETIARRERVHIAVFVLDTLDLDCRATTTFRRYDSGLLVAIVRLPAGADHVELIAHELEHVLEQIEGVDLEALVREGSGAAKRRRDGAYETIRAQHAGVAVAAEVRLARPE